MTTKKKKKPAKKKKPITAGRIPKTDAFLAAYAETASVQKAAEAVGMHKSLHYRWLKDDEEYAGAFAAAQDQAAQQLEDEAVRRAHYGTEEPVVYQGALCYEWQQVIDPDTGEILGNRKTDKPLTIRKYSDSLLQFLLKAFRPAKYKDRAAVEHSGPGGGPIPITDERLAALTDQELESLIPIAEKLTLLGGSGSREKTPAA